MRRKMHIDFSPDGEYELIEISSNLPEYKLCFHINQRLKWKLIRLDDMTIAEAKKKSTHYCIFYYPMDEYTEVFLIGDSCGNKSLMASYYLIIKGTIRENSREKMMDILSNTEGILSTNPISKPENTITDTKTSAAYRIENILLELEYHLLNLSK
ncbi:MAG: IPExxxVDY family protein [Bacteroidales bacterium]|nr:IPExxxVDY family protein [Bacteroidales bacterium]